VTGDETYDATLPFPVRVVPALLMRREALSAAGS